VHLKSKYTKLQQSLNIQNAPLIHCHDTHQIKDTNNRIHVQYTNTTEQHYSASEKRLEKFTYFSFNHVFNILIFNFLLSNLTLNFN
jgi:hypothetical protein